MRFGRTLREAVYPPWRDQYIDYSKLKSLLREDKSDDDNEAWTEEDENRFCDEIFNGQLEKVAQFQQETFDALRQRVHVTFDKLKELAPTDTQSQSTQQPISKADIPAQKLKDLETDLDKITNEVRELKKYSNINYTGFLKIVKKHDRKRGDRYRVRPMMQLSLAQRPFNSEQGYSPLLNKLSIMYFAIRQQLEDGDSAPLDLESQGETHNNGERYTAHKCMLHFIFILYLQPSNFIQSGCILRTFSRSRPSFFDTSPPSSTASSQQRSSTETRPPLLHPSTLTVRTSIYTLGKWTVSLKHPPSGSVGMAK